jgi:hypothetical protein
VLFVIHPCFLFVPFYSSRALTHLKLFGNKIELPRERRVSEKSRDGNFMKNILNQRKVAEVNSEESYLK